jgi:hypothetical protein
MPDLSMTGPPPVGSRIELASTKQNLEAGVTSTSFSFFNQSELWVRVITPAMPKAAQLHLKFFSPKGLLIYDDESAFTTDPAGGQMMMMGEPIDMQLVKSIPGGSALDRGLPLGGTPFIRHPQEGMWRVEATLDGVPGMITTTMSIRYTRGPPADRIRTATWPCGRRIDFDCDFGNAGRRATAVVARAPLQHVDYRAQPPVKRSGPSTLIPLCDGSGAPARRT